MLKKYAMTVTATVVDQHFFPLQMGVVNLDNIPRASSTYLYCFKCKSNVLSYVLLLELEEKK